MKRSLAMAGGLLAALLLAAPASAGPLYRGSTTVPDLQPSGASIDVTVSVDSQGPVVPYEFQIQNECQLPDRTRTVQRDDIAEWTFVDGGDPSAVMPVHLQSIQAGAKCKVFLTRGNVQLKGSVSTYTVD
jgi:hypothetical protein